jgi:hypothetical protein
MSKAAELAALIGSQTALSNRNLIINGAMQVNQRNATTTASGYTVDRFNFVKSTNFDELVMAVTQDTDTPSGQGFSNSLKIAITTAESAIASDEVVYLDQRIEGQNLQHLGFGTSSAKSITLSFFVKSPLAGKHSVLFYDATNTRSNLQAYTVSSANTWEKITITIDGDQSGGFANTNASGLIIFFPLAGGSDYHGTPHTGWGAYTQTDDFMFSDQVNLAGQTGNFFLTGVQLEVGEQATPFEHRSFADELARCQRYFTVINDNLTGDSNDYAAYPAARWSSSQIITTIPLPTSLRASATVSLSGANIQLQSNGSSTAVSTVTHINTGRTQVSIIGNVGFTPASQTAGVGLFLSGARLSLDAEL